MLFRPLLSLSRHQLERYAQAQGLAWIEDPSNQALDFDRNFIRHEILPRLSERWPGCEFRLGRVAELCAETERLNRELGRQDAGFCCSQDDRLSCGALGSLPPERQRNLIRYWLDRHKAPMPERKILDRILTEMVAARADAQPLVCWGSFELRRFRGELYLLRGSSEPVLESQEWDLKAPLVLPQGVLSAELLPGSDAGAGVRENEGGGLRMRLGQCVQVRFRQGGERCRLPGRPGHRSLKELLRCSRIPPWRREGLPLIYVDGELAAIADLWCCEGFELEPGEAGVRFKWSFRE
jgi:tRNA(Ile)-lysidine synthase